MKTKKTLIALGALFALVSSARAGPITRDQVPESLKPWTGWVLRGHEEELCPFLQGLEDERYCAWASPLALSLDEKSGRFSQDWRLFADDWITLAGDDDHWPLGVTVDGRPAAVVLSEDEPQLFLGAGEHLVQGNFQWDSLPESFSIPIETGALRLTVRGAGVARPNITDEGILWLQTRRRSTMGVSSRPPRCRGGPSQNRT